jgi:hypothetical protein
MELDRKATASFSCPRNQKQIPNQGDCLRAPYGKEQNIQPSLFLYLHQTISYFEELPYFAPTRSSYLPCGRSKLERTKNRIDIGPSL